jgi:hypothetical protein
MAAPETPRDFGPARHQNVIGNVGRGAEKRKQEGDPIYFSDSAFVACLVLLRCVMAGAAPSLFSLRRSLKRSGG